MIRILVLVAGLLLWTSSLAQWPSKPIHAVVPSPPGGPPDLILRMLNAKLAAILGQPVIVENRAGAGGVVGTAYVAKAPADGYVWLFTTASHVNTPPFNENVPFEPVRDFTHVTLVAQNFGQALVVPVNSPAKTVADLVALAKKSPGKLNYGSAGIGTASHIPAELMNSLAGIEIVGVQYRGVAEALTDLIAGRVDLFFVGTQLAVQHAESGRVRVLALTGAKRWKGLPGVPTMEEAGFRDFDIVNWFGLWLPAGAAPEIVLRLHGATVKALADPEVAKQFDAQGLEAVGMPPAEFAKFVAKQSELINDLARKINKK
jgi:tripartite-type tricarboxylate transporter receptor subunit TctC